MLVHVKTRSRREVTATKAKSFLVRRGNRVVELAGSDIVVGERLPLVARDVVNGSVLQPLLSSTSWPRLLSPGTLY